MMDDIFYFDEQNILALTFLWILSLVTCFMAAALYLMLKLNFSSISS